MRLTFSEVRSVLSPEPSCHCGPCDVAAALMLTWWLRLCCGEECYSYDVAARCTHLLTN